MNALFFRDYRKFHGGNLKVWDYFNHTRAAPRWDAWIQFAPRSRWDASNPWHAASDRVLADASRLVPDLFFVGGRDWLQLDHHPAAEHGIPIVNLIQHVRHADETSSRFGFLSRKAIRICVSEEVASVVRRDGVANGPVLTIPNAIDLSQVDSAAREDREDDVLIVGPKQPVLARELAERLARPGLRLRALTEFLPRFDFLRLIAGSRVALFLPNETEGFYLPALEGMALGSLVVCPDCLGNRGFVLPGKTGYRPPYEAEALLAAVEDALALDASSAANFRIAARAMAERHGADRERAAFHAVLSDLDNLWRAASG